MSNMLAKTSSQDMKNMKDLIKKINYKTSKLKIKSAFVFSTTTKKSTKNVIVLPLRETRNVICGAVTVYKIESAKTLAKYVDGKVDYVIVDAEQKVRGLENLFEELSSVIKKSKILTFKNNDIAVNTADAVINYILKNLGNNKIAIIGAGNIGSKLALKLVERGATVFISNTTQKKARKVANAINVIKTKYAKGRIISKNKNQITTCVDLLIGATPGIPVITSKLVRQMKNNSIIIDIGTGNIHKNAIKTAQEKNISVLRLDIRTGFTSELFLLFEVEKFFNLVYGQANFKGINISAGGIYGVYGDIVVDKIKNPTKVIGIADGKGGLIHYNITNKLKDKLKTINQLIVEKEKVRINRGIK